MNPGLLSAKPTVNENPGPKPKELSAASSPHQQATTKELEDCCPHLEEEWMKKPKSELQKILGQLQSTLKTVELSLLPDKGEKLRRKRDALLKYLELKDSEDEDILKGFERLSIQEKATKEAIKTKLLSSSELEHWTDLTTSDRPLLPPPAESDKIIAIFQEIRESHKKSTNVLEEIKICGLKSTLLPHQIEAVRWMSMMERFSPYGGILADDMGLGKTVTTLAHVMNELERSTLSGVRGGTTLIIVPTSLLHQWKDEIRRHLDCSKISFIVYHGNDRSKFHSKLNTVDLVVTTYGTFTSKSSTYVQTQSWARTILDEAHYIRNSNCSSFTPLFNISSKYRWVLTGTPIQNSLSDFYSLIKFLRFSPFDCKKNWKEYLENHKHKSEYLRLLVQTLLLRRTKLDKDDKGNSIIVLPSKKEIIHKLNLRTVERLEYERINAAFKKKIIKYFDKKQSNTSTSFVHVIVLLLRLQQACCHHNLLKHNVEDEAIPTKLEGKNDALDDLIADMNKLILNDHHQSSNNDHNCDQDNSLVRHYAYDIKYESSKIRKLGQILKTAEEACYAENSRPFKFVIVSQWTNYLEIIKYHLTKWKYTYDIICGSTSPINRQNVSQKFNYEKHPQILLLSLKAGGVGLNLVGSNNLIIMEQHWNPALEQQACDRIHRVGQTRPTTIHKFIVTDSVEERINKLKEKKLKLARDALNHKPSQSSNQLSKDDVKFIFEIDSSHSVL